jgi:hypothetical protein
MLISVESRTDRSCSGPRKVSEGHDPAFSHMNITATGDERTLQ